MNIIDSFHGLPILGRMIIDNLNEGRAILEPDGSEAEIPLGGARLLGTTCPDWKLHVRLPE